MKSNFIGWINKRDFYVRMKTSFVKFKSRVVDKYSLCQPWTPANLLVREPDKNIESGDF